MRVLILGGNGQVGHELQRVYEGRAEVVAFDRGGLDLSHPDAAAARVVDIRPDVILNAAAYTAVDRAETDEATARLINADAVAALAGAARRLGSLIVHYSTDYVFDGTKADPYTEDDAPCPLNAYGRSKLAGEQALAASGADHLCLRTSWVYATRGRNFLLTMLRLADERPSLRVVDDQQGAPTWARTIAEATVSLVSSCLPRERRAALCGLYHLAARGTTTWYGFAHEIMRLRSAGGLPAPHVEPISSDEYVTPARRPANSRLDVGRIERRFGIALPDWRSALSAAFGDLASQRPA